MAKGKTANARTGRGDANAKVGAKDAATAHEHKAIPPDYLPDQRRNKLAYLGVETFDIDLKEQKVTVKGNVKPEDVFQTVSKSGKKTSYWESEATAPAASAPAEAAASSTEVEAPAAEAAPEIAPAKADA
ncbi:hypothetical protein BAE44_0022269 [Dichanthelium oligosanthes]|uniref:HMA domain-containing protein n=1 Tax=Dichanthelium oligosanthes TaxID=888268 RepID=A0A1E5UUV7_9POAL|nr:hypothetical protein BAE44_0022269 [Dichanthelium oligosanthes]